jgi:HK97 family phage major capsid protein
MRPTAPAQSPAQPTASLLRDTGVQDTVLYRTATLRAIPEPAPASPSGGAPSASPGASRAAEEYAQNPYRFQLSFASEDPYRRWFGFEILGHGKNEVRLDWLAGGTAPLLLQHDPDDPIGIVETATLSKGRASATVRFGRSARAEEIRQDVIDGIRTNVSVGYIVHRMVLEDEQEDGPNTYRVTDWEPLEVSIVSVPADRTVGVGRSASPPTPNSQLPTPNPSPAHPRTQETAMKDKPTDADNPTLTVTQPDPEAQRRHRDQIASDARTEQLRNIEAIQDLAAQHRGTLGPEAADKLANTAIRSGHTVEAFRVALLDAITTRAQGAVQSDPGLSPRDRRDLASFSLCKALREAAFDRALTGIEAEMAIEGEKEMRSLGLTPKGALQLPDLLLRAPIIPMRRDLTVATEGTDLVQTTLGSMIDALRNRLVLTQAGARMLTGLTGNVQFPRLSGASTWTWEGETDAAAESTPTFDNVGLTPLRGGTYVDISKQMLIQSSPDAEALVRDDLNKIAALGIQAAAINGSGTAPIPEGVLNTTGIGDVAGGANGLAPTWANIVKVTSEVAIDNADMGKLGWLINAATRGKLLTTEKAANTAQFILPDQQNAGLVGYPYYVTNAVPSDLDKGEADGVCSAAIFGNWDDLLIGMWGGYDILVDPYSVATTALVRIHIGAFVDVAVRHAQSFAAIQDLLTT